MKKYQLPDISAQVANLAGVSDVSAHIARLTAMPDLSAQVANLAAMPSLSAQVANLAAESDISTHIASLTTMSDLSAQITNLAGVSDVSVHIARLTAMPDLSAQVANLAAMPSLSAQVANLAAESDISTHIASLTTMSDLSAQIANLAAVSDVSAHIARLTAMPDLSAQVANLAAMPSLSAHIASLTAMPDLSAQIANLAAMPDLSSRVAELSKMQDLNVHMAALSVVPRSMLELNVSLDFLKHSVTEACNSGLTVNDNGTIKNSSKELAVLELQELTREVLQRSVEVNQSLESYINCLIYEIKKQKDPFIQRLLSWLFFPLIVGLILSVVTPISEHYVNNYLSKDNRAQVKIIKQNANIAVTDLDLLNEMRFVNTSSLNVRMKPSIKSELIGTLKFSTPIVVIEKKKNWTLVEWVNEEKGVSIKGWVFSRYLQKFR